MLRNAKEDKSIYVVIKVDDENVVCGNIGGQNGYTF